MTKEKKGQIRTEFGTIPEDWNYEPLENFFSYISYGFTNPMPTTEKGVYMITAADISNGEIQYEGARHTSKWAFDSLLTQKSRPQIDDILLTKDGTLGRVALVDRKNICINQSVAVIRPNDRIEPLFLKYLLEGPEYQKIMIQNAGGSTIKHLYITKVNLMEIGVPSKKEEQQAIASALSDVDELIRSLDGLIQKKQAIKKGTMQQLLTGKKRLPGFGGEWGEVKSGEVVEYINGRAYSKNEWESKGTPVVRLQNLTGSGENYYYSNLNLPEKNYMYYGDLIFMWSASFGPYIWRGPKAIYHYHIWKIDCNEEKIDKMFYYHKLVRLTEELKQTTSGSTMLHLTKAGMEKFKLNLPPLEEQKAIAQILSDMDRELQTLRQKREKYVKIKQGMMQELLTGRVRLIAD